MVGLQRVVAFAAHRDVVALVAADRVVADETAAARSSPSLPMMLLASALPVPSIPNAPSDEVRFSIVEGSV